MHTHYHLKNMASGKPAACFCLHARPLRERTDFVDLLITWQLLPASPVSTLQWRCVIGAVDRFSCVWQAKHAHHIWTQKQWQYGQCDSVACRVYRGRALGPSSTSNSTVTDSTPIQLAPQSNSTCIPETGEQKQHGGPIHLILQHQRAANAYYHPHLEL